MPSFTHTHTHTLFHYVLFVFVSHFMIVTPQQSFLLTPPKKMPQSLSLKMHLFCLSDYHMLLCITNHSRHSYSALLSALEAWEGRSCVLIKLVRAVVFGKPILVFVFPKSPLSFWFTTPLWTVSPLPHNEISRHCGTEVFVSGCFLNRTFLLCW